MGALHSNCVILQTGQTYQSKCVTKRRSICWGLLPRVYGSHQWITYTKLNPHMCPLSDQKDFGIHHHIREKRCGTLLNWTRGHTVATNVLSKRNSAPRRGGKTRMDGPPRRSWEKEESGWHVCVARSPSVNEMKRRFEREQSEGARMSLSGGAKFFQSSQRKRRRKVKEMRSSQKSTTMPVRASESARATTSELN